VVWLLGVAIAQDCAPQPVAALDQALASAEAAFASADLPSFREAQAEAERVASCLGAPATVALSARMHRMEGLAAFFAEDATRSAQAFGSARRLEPEFRFDSALVPPGNPLLEVYFLQDPHGVPAEPLPAPADGELLLDGRVGEARPKAGPTLFQHQAGDQIAVSSYLWPIDPVPAYPLPAAPVVAPRRPARVPLAIAAAASAVLGAGLYGVNRSVHARYDSATSTSDLDRLRGLNNGLVVGSGVALASGLGLGVAAVAVR